MQPLKVLAITVVTLAGPAVALAQCPDGTPPPCSARAAPRTTTSSAGQVVVAPPPAADRARRFLILPFRNVTRQPDQDWLVEGSTTMLVDALGRWQGISVVPDEKLYPALKRAGIVPGTIAEPARVRRVAEETGGWTAVTGEVLSTGGRVRITARAWDVPTSRELVRASSEVPAGGDVRIAYDSVSLRLLRSAGFDASTPDLAEATTRNVDAYRAYLRGLAHIRRSEATSAIRELHDAIRQDSSFALAWARLADVTISTEPGSIVNSQSNAAKYSARAVELSAKLPARDRQLLLASNASFGARFDEVRRILGGLLAADSNDVEALNAMVSLEMFDPILVTVPGGQRPRGSYNRAARHAKRITELDPSRRSMFGLLAQLYAQAGVPGAQPALGVDRAPTSYADLIQILQQTEHRRVYYPLLGDSIMLIPAESLSAIPKARIDEMRRSARSAARAWAERWLAGATGESAPYALLAELYALDGQFPQALRALATADSIGVQNPAWSGAAKRMVYLAKSGNYAVASRLADSLSTAGFFANPNRLLTNIDAGAWAFALHLISGRMSQAGALIENQLRLRRMMNPVDPPEYTAYILFRGNSDPEEEPGLPRAVRAMELDSLLARINEAAASPQLAPWIPMIVPWLAEVAGSTASRGSALLKAAETLAASGKRDLAFQLASNTIANVDTTLETRAATLDWYRAGVEPLNASRGATMERFKPGTATVTADRAVFEWSVADSAPFLRNRPEVPAGRAEYMWEVRVNAGDRYFAFRATALTRSPTSPPVSGSLADILPASAQRYVFAGALSSTGQEQPSTIMQGIALRTEIGPGVLRMVVTDRSVLDALRRTRPAEARFHFYPCVKPLGTDGQNQCTEGKVTITYQ